MVVLSPPPLCVPTATEGPTGRDEGPEKGRIANAVVQRNAPLGSNREKERKRDPVGPILRTIGGVQVSVVRPAVGTSVSAAM